MTVLNNRTGLHASESNLCGQDDGNDAKVTGRGTEHNAADLDPRLPLDYYAIDVTSSSSIPF